MTRWLLTGLCSMLLMGAAHAATLTWDRNSEPDLQDYRLWACFTPGCVVVQSTAMLQPGAILQSDVGVRVSVVLDWGEREGAVAVSARDTSGNESGLSVPLPFDYRAPAVPQLPRLTP